MSELDKSSPSLDSLDSWMEQSGDQALQHPPREADPSGPLGAAVPLGVWDLGLVPDYFLTSHFV